jgi:hypothetical protein
VFYALDLTDEQKDFITNGIIEGTIKLMKSTVRSETYKERANKFTNPRYQSKNAITKDTIQYNILNEIQKFLLDRETLEKNLKKKKEILRNLN